MASSAKQGVILSFYADKCKMSTELAPRLEAAVDDTHGKLQLARVNVDRAGEKLHF